MPTIRHVEIPVDDLDRAIAFYARVFDVVFDEVVADGYRMALFPLDAQQPGASCALVQGDVYRTGKAGALIYFGVERLEHTLRRAEDAGGRMLYPPTTVGDWGRVAEFEDSEGNRIGLHEAG